jgi:hypothetical protein
MDRFQETPDCGFAVAKLDLAGRFLIGRDRRIDLICNAAARRILRITGAILLFVVDVVAALFAVLVTPTFVQAATVTQRRDRYHQDQNGCGELSHDCLAMSAHLNRNVFAEH